MVIVVILPGRQQAAFLTSPLSHPPKATTHSHQAAICPLCYEMAISPCTSPPYCIDK